MTAVDVPPRPTVYRAPSARCRGCRYLLNGLAAVGTCPECGQGYDVEVLLLHGRTRDGLANPATAWLRLYGPAITLSAIVVVQVVALGVTGFSWQMAIPVAATTGIICLLLHRARQGLRPEPVEIRLNANGCLQTRAAANEGIDVSAAGGIEAILWRNVMAARVEPVEGGRVRLVVRRRPAWWQRWRSEGVPAIDADLHAGPEEIRSMSERIDKWRSARGRPE